MLPAAITLQSFWLLGVLSVLGGSFLQFEDAVMKKYFYKFAFAAICAMVTLLANQSALCSAEDAQPKGRRWVQEANRSLALAENDAIIWRFNYGEDQTKPNFFPLGLPGGQSLVVDRPADHPWHHGFWFSWKFINGVNFWEPDPKTKRPAGRTSWSDMHVAPRKNLSALISMKLDYSIDGKEPILAEDRVIEVTAPDKSGQYALDWKSTFRAGKGDVELACVPIPPAKDGVRWGGYAGLSVRFAKELADREACSAEGPVTFDGSIYRGQSNAMDYSGSRDGQVAGIAIVDHPANPRHPADWYVIRSEMSYINAALLSQKPLPLKAGESLTLRYRVIVHPNRWDAARLKTETEKFAKP